VLCAVLCHMTTIWYYDIARWCDVIMFQEVRIHQLIDFVKHHRCNLYARSQWRIQDFLRAERTSPFLLPSLNPSLAFQIPILLSGSPGYYPRKIFWTYTWPYVSITISALWRMITGFLAWVSSLEMYVLYIKRCKGCWLYKPTAVMRQSLT